MRDPCLALPSSKLLAAVNAPAEIVHAVAKYADLDVRLSEADVLKAELERKVMDAEQADIAARAEAAAGGKSAPAAGTKRIEVAKAERDAQAREVQGLELARARTRLKIDQAVAEYQAAFGERLDEQLGETRGAFGAVLDQLQAAHAEITSRMALRAWVAGDPSGVPGRWNPGSFSGRLKSLTAPSGEPLTAGEAIGALREVADAVPPRPIESVGVQSQRGVERSLAHMQREAEQRGVPPGALASTPVRDYDTAA